MSTATLSETAATQLTFPWAMPQTEQVGTIVAESVPTTTRRQTAERVKADRNVREPMRSVEPEQVAPSLQAALVGDRIGKSFKVGDVMFRLLKSYGITDEEIAAGIASYNAKRARAQ